MRGGGWVRDGMRIGGNLIKLTDEKGQTHGGQEWGTKAQWGVGVRYFVATQSSNLQRYSADFIYVYADSDWLCC